MKIVVIQPSSTNDLSKEKGTEFKLNMCQFNVLDRVDFFKKTSQLICSDLINVFVSKEKLQRYFRKMERKLKTENTKKKYLKIKNT